MRIALVHDYLTRLGGAERVLFALSQIFPKASIFTLIYNEKKVGKFFSKDKIHCSFLQKYPKFFRNHPKYLLPFLAPAVESIDLRNYDLIISSSSAFIKGIIVKPKSIHICYCHSPVRFLWDWTHEYYQENKFSYGIIAKFFIHYLRMWDKSASQRVDFFIANSQTTANRINKYYRKEAKVIYPPCDLINNSIKINHIGNKNFKISKNRDYFLIVSQLTPYKKLDIAIKAFNKLELPLLIVGEGPDRCRLEKIAQKNIKFAGFQPEESLVWFYQNCKALIFPGEDDFGITPVEAMNFGKPVLALRKGGATESIIEGVTGEFFDDPIAEILADGVRRLLENYSNFNPLFIKKRAERFSQENFKKEILDFVNKVCYNN
ncbi:MAG: glycosyltransferase [Spirochaetota bacterium]|nr:glycosyltransferase [Spirochaetota bacterium]